MERKSRTAAICQRVARASMILFAVALALLVGTALAPSKNYRLIGMIGMAEVLAMTLSAVVLIVAIATRDAATNRWRFSLRGLLLMTTAVALLLGLVAYAMRD